MALDIDVVNLAKAIRQHETGNRPISGATGEMASRYQYLPSTWKSTAGKYLGDPNAPLTLENENKATYLKIKDWKDAGYNPAQIASLWNSGNPDMYAKGNRGVGKSSANQNVTFNVPKYVQSVYSIYQQEKAKNPPIKTAQAAQPTIAQPAQPTAPVKKPGFFDMGGPVSKVLQAGSTMLGLPALVENIASIGEAGAYGINKLLGREEQAKQILEHPISAPQKAAATQGTMAGVKNAIGQTIESGLGASILATGGLGAGAKATQVATKAPGFFRTVGTGAKIGAGYGAGFGVAEGLKQNLDTPSIIGEGLKSGVTGGILGGGLGLAGYGLSKVAGKVATSAAAKKAGISTKEMGNIAKVEEELYNIENNYAKLRKVNQFEKDAGAASRRRIAESNVLAGSIDENGRIITKSIDGPIEKYKNATIGEYENLVGKLLEKEGARVTPAFIAKKLQDTLMKSGLEGNALKTALSRIESEVQGLMLRADKNGLIPLSSVHYAKIATTNGINYATEPFVAAERKAIAKAYKELVEQVSKENIKPINKEIQKYLKDIKLLENLDGKIVKGGKLGKYFSQIAGNLSGAAVGGAIGGPLGMVSGTVAGGEIASRIKGKTIQGILGRGQFKAPKKSEVLQKALNESEARVKVTQKGGKQRVPVEVMPEDRPGRLLPPPRPKVNVLPKGNVIQVGAPRSAGEKTKESIGILAKRLKESNVKQEAKKYSSALEALRSPEMKVKLKSAESQMPKKVTKTSNNLYHSTSADNLDSIIKGGLKTGQKPKFEGVSSPNKISFSANEDSAKYYGGDVMIRTKTSYKPTDLELDLLAGGEGTYLTGKNIPPEMLEIKVGNKWIPLTKYKQGILSKSFKDKPGFIGQDNTSPLLQEAKKYSSYDEFEKAIDVRYRDSWMGDKDKNADRLMEAFGGLKFHGTNAVDQIKKTGFTKKHWWNSGVYFSDVPDVALKYAGQNRAARGDTVGAFAVDLSKLKIKEIPYEDFRGVNKGYGEMEDMVTKLKKQGYDGIREKGGESLVWNVDKLNKTAELNTIKDIWNKANKLTGDKPGYIGSDFAKNKAKQEFGKTGTGMLIKGAVGMGAVAAGVPMINNILKNKTKETPKQEVAEPTKEPEKPKTKDEEIEDYVKSIKVTINKGRADLGNTLAEENNNPGNLYFANQPNATKNGKFAQFPTPELGFRALIKDVQAKQKKGLTLEEMMNIYAPPEENDTDAYLDALEGWLNVKREDKASGIDPIELAKRIAQFESQTVVE